MYIYIYTCIYTHKYTNIYTYIYIHIYTQQRASNYFGAPASCDLPVFLLIKLQQILDWAARAIWGQPIVWSCCRLARTRKSRSQCFAGTCRLA